MFSILIDHRKEWPIDQLDVGTGAGFTGDDRIFSGYTILDQIHVYANTILEKLVVKF